MRGSVYTFAHFLQIILGDSRATFDAIAGLNAVLCATENVAI